MPLTNFQHELMSLLAAHRSPDSHVGGDAVINRTEGSPRYSSDIDFFHDTAEIVFASAEADAGVLIHNGLTVNWLMRQPFMHRAEVRRNDNYLRLDWCYDSAFRFFPVLSDPEFGYCLHPADLAVNKALALAGRTEIRDYLDILFLNDHYLSLGAMCWAASGKDQGLTPWSILDFAKRNMKFRREDLADERLAQPQQLTTIKETWLRIAAEADEWSNRMPAIEAGCLYLDANLNPITPDPSRPEFATLVRHFASLRGAWPRFA
jgi:hypothetical protein